MTGTEKREYLIRTLSRTKRKDYENYVIGAIVHMLNTLVIKQVSQYNMYKRITTVSGDETVKKSL